MSKSKISPDNFLKEESSFSPGLMVTLELDEQNMDNVIISLWESDYCNCNEKFSVAKKLIDSIEKSQIIEYCCGKRHTVVKLNFMKEAVHVEDLFLQINKKRAKLGESDKDRRKNDNYNIVRGSYIKIRND